jgi:hypothetical protein
MMDARSKSFQSRLLLGIMGYFGLRLANCLLRSSELKYALPHSKRPGKEKLTKLEINYTFGLNIQVLSKAASLEVTTNVDITYRTRSNWFYEEKEYH